MAWGLATDDRSCEEGRHYTYRGAVRLHCCGAGAEASPSKHLAFSGSGGCRSGRTRSHSACVVAKNPKKRAWRMISRPSKGERCLVPRPGERWLFVERAGVRPSRAPDAEQSCFPDAGCRRACLRRASLLRVPVPARRGRFQGRYGRCGWRSHSRCTGSAQ